MAISEFETKRVEKLAQEYVDRHRPPVHVRSQLDIEYLINDQSLELLEVRPRWDNPDEIFRTSFAKCTFVKKTKTWKVYWMRQDLKWHSYEPVPEVPRLEDFIEVVSEDKMGCFRG